MIRYHKRLLQFGIGMGVCFPVMGILLDLYLKDLGFSWSAVRQLHEVNPLHWIIDSAPFVLGTIFYFLGKNIVEREQRLKDLNAVVANKCSSISAFVEALHRNNFSVEYDNLDEDDVLKDILTKFRDELKEKNETEKIRTWTNEGLAKFGVLMRTDSSDISSFCQQVLSSLVSYLEMNQGGIFVLSDEAEEPCLELRASFAWGKDRMVERKIRRGETLVGQCWIERKIICLTKVPENYISITSGLGDSLPRYVILLPLDYKDSVYGVLELASFQPLESFQVEFLEEIAKSIASVLSTLQTNARILSLLEQTQQQKAKI